jgi:copper oxidase (laccase) domain-containing protein
MAFKLKVDIPNAGDEGSIAIAGIGELQNGKTYEISDEAAERFRAMHATVEDAYDGEGNLVGRQLVDGPSLAEALFHGVTIEEMKATPPKTPTNAQEEGN